MDESFRTHANTGRMRGSVLRFAARATASAARNAAHAAASHGTDAVWRGSNASSAAVRAADTAWLTRVTLGATTRAMSSLLNKVYTLNPNPIITLAAREKAQSWRWSVYTTHAGMGPSGRRHRAERECGGRQLLL